MTKITSRGRRTFSEREFAFPAQRKEPLENATHVRNVVARFTQVRGVTDEERDVAWRRILLAAKGYGVTINSADWRDLPHRARNDEM